MKIIKLLFFILVTLISCNSVFAQSLGKMTLGCKRADIPLSLPKGFNVCKTNTSNQLTYGNSGYDYVSFYLNDNIVTKIEMHRFLLGFNTTHIESQLEEIFISLCETWGEPSYVGENIYWYFPTSKATFSHTVTTEQFYGPHGIETQYNGYITIKLEKRTNLFE